MCCGSAMGAKQGAKVPVVVWAVSGLRPHSEGAGVKLPPLEQTRPAVAWRGKSDQATARFLGRARVPPEELTACFQALGGHSATPLRHAARVTSPARWHWMIALGGDSEVGLLPGCSGSQVDVAPVLMARPAQDHQCWMSVKAGRVQLSRVRASR